MAEEYRGLENSEAASQFRLLDEDIVKEEVVQALGGLKGKVAAGANGLTAEMVRCDILVDF